MTKALILHGLTLFVKGRAPRFRTLLGEQA